MLSLEDLRAFLVVAQEGALKGASDRLNKTQSAVSQAVRRLEEELNLTLFDRSGYRIALTTEGQEILKKAEFILSEATNLKEYAVAISADQEHVYRVAIHSNLSPNFYAPILHHIANAFPRTNVQVIKEDVGGAFIRLDRGEVDLAISPWHAISTAYQSIDIISLGSLGLVNVIHKKLAIPEETPDKLLAYLRTIPQVVVKSSVEGDQGTYGILEGGRHIYVNSISLKTEIIRSAIGWGRVPSHLVQSDLDAELLCAIALPGMPGELSVEVRALRRRMPSYRSVATSVWKFLSQ